MKIPFTFKNSEEDTPISVLDLSVRTENACKRNNITTIYELVNGREKLIKTKGFGVTCLKEINSKLVDWQICKYENDPDGLKKWLQKVVQYEMEEMS